MSPALRLPGAPFDLAQAQTAAQLVGEAYSLTKQWKEAGRPAPDAWTWTPDEALAGFTCGAPLWANVVAALPFDRPQPFGFLARAGATAYLAIRGTENPIDMLANLDVGQVEYGIDNCAGFGKVHGGFLTLYKSLREAILAQLQAAVRTQAIDTLVVCGHSMGAAVSTVALPDLARNAVGVGRLIHYGLGSPRVGDLEFAAGIEGLASTHEPPRFSSYRLANSADPIVNLPPAVIDRLVRADTLYQHVGDAVVFAANAGSASRNHHCKHVYIRALDEAQEAAAPAL